jgi:predicted membrane-bound spermidine synthase
LARSIHFRLIILFLISGAAALIYQICWQRLLFESVGVDIDSITIIVSTFMLGLGVGSLVGGVLADRYTDRMLELFAGMELLTAAFGALSPLLIHAVSMAVVRASLPVIVSANFGLLLLPTTMMGATLPILVRQTLRRYRNMGESVGVLYFSNTLGAAIGAAFTGFFALYRFGLGWTIRMAACLNVLVAVAVWLTLRVRRA